MAGPGSALFGETGIPGAATARVVEAEGPRKRRHSRAQVPDLGGPGAAQVEPRANQVRGSGRRPPGGAAPLPAAEPPGPALPAAGAASAPSPRPGPGAQDAVPRRPAPGERQGPGGKEAPREG